MRVAKAGPRSWTAAQLERMRVFYISVRGNLAKTSAKFKTSEETISRLSRIHGWKRDIPVVEAATREIANRTVAEARAKVVCTIDEYTDAQAEVAGAIPEKFDAQGFERMVKTRELLTGGDTERLGLNLSEFLSEWGKLGPEKRRELLARARSKRSAS